MKKIFALCFFALTLMLGTQSITAQEKYKTMSEQIKMEAQELQKLLDLDNEQTALLARTIYVREKGHSELKAGGKLSPTDVTELREKIDMNYKSRLLEILSEEQFQKFSEYQAKKASKKE